jgi:hypothetical protein
VSGRRPALTSRTNIAIIYLETGPMIVDRNVIQGFIDGVNGRLGGIPTGKLDVNGDTEYRSTVINYRDRNGTIHKNVTLRFNQAGVDFMRDVRNRYYAMESTPEGVFFYKTKEDMPVRDLRQKGDALVHLRYYNGVNNEPVPSYIEFFKTARQQTLSDLKAGTWKFGWADVVDSAAVDTTTGQRHLFVNNLITELKREDVFNRNGNLLTSRLPQLQEVVHFNPITWDESYATSTDLTKGVTLSINGQTVNNAIRIYRVDRKGDNGQFTIDSLSTDGKQVLGQKKVNGVEKTIIDVSSLTSGSNLAPIKVEIYDL